MIVVGTTQFSYRYGDQLHMPYTIAILVSYLKSNDTIRNDCKFLPTAVSRLDFDKYIDLYRNIDVLLCSCYIWNWEITKKFANKIKQINPKCLIIFGGPQIPENCKYFFDEHDFVDLVVHNEGEYVLTNIFLNHIESKSFDEIKQVSSKTKPAWESNNITVDVNSIPSPYLTNVMWELIDKNEDIKWLAIMETMRGCPYHCSYCAWGATAYNKIRKFNLERIFKEIDFFSDNKLTYIDCSDANFGMFERDVEITDYIVNKKKSTGYPTNFKPCWDKKANDRIKYIAKELKSVNLLISVGCSLQTLSPETLRINNRKSISFKEFIDITDSFKKNGSQCYTEMIRGLPGETIDSFKEGLNRIIFESDVDTIFIYNCSSYESTELNNPSFIEKYKIKTIKSPIFLSHMSEINNDIPEYDNIVSSCFSFTENDIKDMNLYSWYILTFQSLGICNYITKYVCDKYSLTYTEFYDKLIKYCQDNINTLLGKEYNIVKQYIDDGYSGKGWNHFDHSLGDINWPIEEASFLRLIKDRSILKNELTNFLKTISNIDVELTDLIKFQMYVLSDKNKSEYITENFDVDWKLYFSEKILKQNKTQYSYKNKIPIFSDDFDWNIKCIWHGRRKINYKLKLSDIILLDI